MDQEETSDTRNDQRVQNSQRFKGSNAQITSPTFQQLLQSDGSKWSHISSQIKKKNHGQEDDGNHHIKKSILAKVKEKAKKFKFSLSGKKHSDKNESPGSSTRSSDVRPKDKADEDSEYHSARSNTTEAHSKSHAPLDLSVVVEADSDTRTQTALTTDISKVHEFQERNLRFSGVMVSNLESSKNKFERSVEEGDGKKGESQTRDKEGLVKEYLMQKFEPGEDERELSKVITQTINPRRDKMRDAMSSFLKNEESSEVNLSTNIGSKNAPIDESHTLGISNASKASMNLNQTFKTTFASYQDHFLGSSSNRVHGPTKTGSLPWGHDSNANDQTPAHVSSGRKTRGPGHTATSVRRIPVSRPNQTRVPSRTEPNTVQAPISTGNQGRFVYDHEKAIASLSAYCKNQQCIP